MRVVLLILAFISSVYSGYGVEAGYPKEFKYNIQNQQWALVGVSGVTKTNQTDFYCNNASGNSVGVDLVSTAPTEGEANVTNQDATGAFVSSATGVGADDNATVSITQESAEYLSQLLAHSKFGTNYVGDVAISFIQKQVNSGASAKDNSMIIKVDGDTPTTNAIITVNYSSSYNGDTFYISLEANDTNETFYTFTFQNGVTKYLINDPVFVTQTALNQIIDINNTAHLGSGMDSIDVLKSGAQPEGNMSIWSWNNTNQSWGMFEANLSGKGVVTDTTSDVYYSTIYDREGNASLVDRAKAYWIKLNYDRDVLTTFGGDYNMSVNLIDDDLNATDVAIELANSSGWNLITLPEGHIKHSQTGMCVKHSNAQTISITGTQGTLRNFKMSSTSLSTARNLNSAIEGNSSGVLLKLRAYPAYDSSDCIMLISDDIFKVETTLALQTLSGRVVSSNELSSYGETALAFHVNEPYLDGDYSGQFVIDFPDLSSGFSGVEINTSSSSINNTQTLIDEIKTQLSLQAGLTYKTDYNITDFDANFDGVYDDILIAFKPIYERSSGTNSVTGDSHNDKYLRFGIRENSYIKPYLVRYPTSIAKTSISVKTPTGEPLLEKGDFYSNGAKKSLKSYRDSSGVEFNMTTFATDGNYTYFTTNSRTLDIYEDNTSADSILTDVIHLSSTQRKAIDYASYRSRTYGKDLNSSMMAGAIENVYTMADLAQVPLAKSGVLSSSYSSVVDLKANAVYTADMPKSGPLYDLLSTGKEISKILTFNNGKWRGVTIESDADSRAEDMKTWFGEQSLFYIDPFHGCWVKTDTSLDSVDNMSATSADSAENLVSTHFDNYRNVAVNKVYKKWTVNSVSTSNVPSATLEIKDLNVSFNTITSTKYESLIDVYSMRAKDGSYSIFGETGFSATQTVYIYDGFVYKNLGNLVYSIQKPAVITLSDTDNNKFTVNSDTSNSYILMHKDEVNEGDLNDSLIQSSTSKTKTILPSDINFTVNSLDFNDTNESVIKIYAMHSTSGLSGDMHSSYYPHYNSVLLKSGTDLTKATESDLAQVEALDTDGDFRSDTYAIYEMISDDGSDANANSTPKKYDIDGNLIDLSAVVAQYSTGFDGVQVLSTQSNKKVVISYRPNSVSSLSTQPLNMMRIFDSGVEIAQIGFKSSAGHDYNGTKWYLYSEHTDKMYVGVFEKNTTSGAINTSWDCSASSSNANTKCYRLNTTRNLVVN
jgi:hypothetical protein